MLRSFRRLIVLSAASVPTILRADPVKWPVNGHHYEVITLTTTWPQAEAGALARTWLGVQGHLVTVTSAAENLFLTQTFGASTLDSKWLGGFQLPGSIEPAGGWVWVTGEPFDFNGWSPGEPNNFGFGGNEDAMNFAHSVQPWGKPWNDGSALSPSFGYVVEYDTVVPIINSIAAVVEDSPPIAIAIGVYGDVFTGSTSVAAEPHAIRWTPTGGTQDLGVIPGGTRTLAHGMTFDGSTIVGEGNTATSNGRAFRWTAATGCTELSGGFASFAVDCNIDGSMIAGTAIEVAPDFQIHACRWVGGVFEDLGLLPGTSTSTAMGVSATGQVVAGQSDDRSFRWTAATGMVDLGLLPGASVARANALSDDGTTIVGASNGGRAFRWTQSGGMHDMGLAVGEPEVRAWAISGTGGTVVGSAGSSATNEFQAALWTADTGWLKLADWFVSIGIDLTGWELRSARAISPEGTAIAGFGTYNGEARTWVVANLPELCMGINGDMNCDCFVTVTDVAGFVLALTDAAMYDIQFPNCDNGNADINGDGLVSVSDIGPFVTALTGG